MGTRADFYIGEGENAEWLGSVAWDGYEWETEPDCPLMTATTEEEFRVAIKEISKQRKDWTSPEQGWPWPWEDSHLTDYVYAFVNNKAKAYPSTKGTIWPNMKEKQKVTFGERSGLLIFGQGENK